MSAREILKDCCIFSTKKNSISNKKTYWIINQIFGDEEQCNDIRIGIFLDNEKPQIICTMKLNGERYLKLFDNIEIMKLKMQEIKAFDINLQKIENIFIYLGR